MTVRMLLSKRKTPVLVAIFLLITIPSIYHFINREADLALESRPTYPKRAENSYDDIVRFTQVNPVGEMNAGKIVGLEYAPSLAPLSGGIAPLCDAVVSKTEDVFKISWDGLGVQASLVKGLFLKARGISRGNVLVKWTTNEGAQVEFTSQITNLGEENGFNLFEIRLDQNENWRDIIDSLRIRLQKSQDNIEIDELKLLPNDLAGQSSRFRVDRVLGDCMVQMVPYEYVFRLKLPASPCLSFGTRVLSTEYHDEAEATFSILTKQPGESVWSEIFSKEMTSAESLAFFKVPLEELQNKNADIRFKVHASSGQAAGIWHSPIVFSRRRVTERNDCILYVVDALRTDHLGIYGYKKEVSPRIDAFADDGVTFKNAYSQSSWTRTSFASIMTSLYPDTHGVKHSMEVSERLADRVTTLAEIFRENGFVTVGFIVNGFAQSDFGLDQGFDLSYEYPNKFPGVPYYVTVQEVTDDVLDWLQQNADLNYFMTIFVVDPHEPYVPPVSYCEILGCSRPIDSYDAEIRFVDDQFGKLLDTLERLNADGSTTMIFTSDHGEEFRDHGGYYHGNTLYEEVLRVPLIIRVPEAEKGRRIDQLVEHIDVAPTVLDLFRVHPPPQWQGRSLAPLVLANANTLPQKPLFFHLNRRVNQVAKSGGRESSGESFTRSVYAVRKDDIKLIETRENNDFPEWELYDLSKDPGEKASSIISHPVQFYRMWSTLRALKKIARQESVESEVVRETVSKEEIERLKAIGYLQ